MAQKESKLKPVMRKYHKNPRKITEKQLENLRRDLIELGDLSGVIHNINSNEIIGGNQRSTVFDINKCDIQITKEFTTPTRTGTVAEGFVLWEGERYAYRRVDWTKEQCEKACIVANKAGGDWDWDILVEDFQGDDLKKWGFENKELKMFEEDKNIAWGSDVLESWFLNIEFETEKECSVWYDKLKKENLKVKIIQ